MSTINNYRSPSTSNVFNDRENPHLQSRSKQYFKLSDDNWNNPYNKLLRNAFFDEPLENKLPPLLRDSYSNYRPATLRATLKPGAINSSKIEKIRCVLKKTIDCSLPNDFYSNGVSSAGSFTSHINVNPVTNNLKVIRDQKLVDFYNFYGSETISAVQVDPVGTNYIGTEIGNCYSIDPKSKEIKHLINTADTPFEGSNDFDPQICSIALKDSSLYLSNKSGHFTIISLREEVPSFGANFPIDSFVCRILPPFKNEHLLALGHNDNTVSIYDLRRPSESLHIHTAHQSAIRALAWNPECRHELASGGGTNDRQIHIWNANSTSDNYFFKKTNAQICNLFWNIANNKKHLIAIEGFGSAPGYQIPIYLWDNSRLTEQTVLNLNEVGKGRPLHSAIGNTPNKLIVGGEGYLQFWDLFQSHKTPNYEERLTEQFSIR